MAECVIDSDVIYGRIMELNFHICRVIRAPSVVRHLANFISDEDVVEISSIDSRNPESATFMLIMIILKSDQPGKWKAFIDALLAADYPYVVSLLMRGDMSLTQYLHSKTILQIFAPSLEGRLHPYDLISHLAAKDVVNIEDTEEIRACFDTNGSVAATMLMLDRIQRRQDPAKWYLSFLKILYEKGHMDIVQMMEPEFKYECEVLKSPDTLLPPVPDPENTDCSEIADDDNIEEMIEAKVMYFKSELTALLKLQKLAPALCQLLDIGKVYDLSRIISPKECIDTFLEEMHRLKDRTKWRTFINCLRKSDYPHLADILSRPCFWKQHCVERSILKLFLPEIGRQIDTLEFVSRLEEENLINQTDREEILATHRQYGCVAASFVLIDCLQCRAPPHVWFRTFKKVLVDFGRTDLAKLIDPDLKEPEEMSKDDLERNPMICNILSKRDEVLNHIYRFEKTAKANLDIIHKRYKDLMDNLKRSVEDIRLKWTKVVHEADEIINKVHTDVIPIDEDAVTKIGKTLQLVMSTQYVLQPDSSFMQLECLGSLKDPKTCSKRQNTIGRYSNVSLVEKRRRLKLFNKYKVDMQHVLTESTGSSDSSHSSGFVTVGKSTMLSELTSQKGVSSDSTSPQSSRESSCSSLLRNSSGYLAFEPSHSISQYFPGSYQSFDSLPPLESGQTPGLNSPGTLSSSDGIPSEGNDSLSQENKPLSSSSLLRTSSGYLTFGPPNTLKEYSFDGVDVPSLPSRLEPTTEVDSMSTSGNFDILSESKHIAYSSASRYSPDFLPSEFPCFLRYVEDIEMELENKYACRSELTM